MPRPRTALSIGGRRGRANRAQRSQTGVTRFRLLAGKRSPFPHRHAAREEIYVILGRTGRLKLDDDII